MNSDLKQSQDFASLSNQDLETLYKKLKWQYDRETKSLYKRHIGGKMLTVLKEIRRRNENKTNL